MNKKSSQTASKISVFLLMLSLLIACESTNDPLKYNPPADHTVSKDGYMHKTGLDQPLTNCASCHGSDLQGGTTAVSCYECHGKEW